MNALDLMSALPPRPNASTDDPRALESNLFQLLCAAEYFEQQVSERFCGLAGALRVTSARLYDSVRILNNPFAAIDLIPIQVPNAYKRFENVYLCLDELQEEFTDENWRTQVTWSNIKALYRTMRVVLVQTMRQLS